jgi:hypothetical protein
VTECRKYRDMISCYADGELSGNAKEELERHLKICASCRSLLTIYQNITESAASLMAEPPDSFTESVMSKIKALSENVDAGHHTEGKHKRLARPVIISFVAAAACLVLAFIMSPKLFGITGIRNEAASMPMVPAAPAAAAYDAAAQEDLMEFRAVDAERKAELDKGTESTSSGTQNSASDSGPAAQEPLKVEASAMPSAAAGAVPQEETWKNSADELRKYYAIFTIEGRLPDGLDEKSRTDNRDGTFYIEISVETANQLLKDGYPAEMGAQESIIALIKYTPQS